jgi:NADPH:quinone reductase-like Zn-dependent oxidoreductase
MLALVPTDGTDPLVALADTHEPQPQPNEAVLQVEAFSPNRGELFLLERPRPGWRPGKDVAGRVVQPAADGTGPQEGERVVGHPPAGGWAERVAMPTTSLATLPDGIDATTAAALPLAGLTALRLIRAAGPMAGARILLTGASGGVGHYVTELASAAGAEITAVSRRPERLRALGAASVVPRVEDARPPFDVVLESVGGESLPQALSRLRKGGRLIWFGQASRQPPTLDFFAHFEQTGATIRHFHYEDGDRPLNDDLATLTRLVAQGRLHPEIGLTEDWREAPRVLAALRDRKVRGNAVLHVPTRGAT